MGTIKVTAEELEQLSTRLGAGASSIQEQLDSLRNSVAPLVGGDWAGTASDRFNALWTEWQSGARQIHEALTGLSSLLQGAGQAYAQTEAQIAKSMGGN
jgi:WXG100 family type VII secretion target